MGRSKRAVAREAGSSAGDSVPQGTAADVAAVPAVSPPAPAYELVGLSDSARPGWHILQWRHAGDDGEVIRSNVNPDFLRHKLTTPNEVLRGLYEWQLQQLPA